MANIKVAREGALLPKQPSGIPLFFERRVATTVVSDPWAFLRDVITRESFGDDNARLLAYIEQASDFFTAAENPRVSSRPLLYYYLFLNLAKVACALHDVDMPPKLRHGLSDPHTNRRERIKLSGQTVRPNGIAVDHSNLFPEFCNLFGCSPLAEQDIRVVDILRQTPCLHRAYCTIENTRESHLPIARIRALAKDKELWIRVELECNDRSSKDLLSEIRSTDEFQRTLTAVRSPAIPSRVRSRQYFQRDATRCAAASGSRPASTRSSALRLGRAGRRTARGRGLDRPRPQSTTSSSGNADAAYGPRAIPSRVRSRQYSRRDARSCELPGV